MPDSAHSFEPQLSICSGIGLNVGLFDVAVEIRLAAGAEHSVAADDYVEHC